MIALTPEIVLALANLALKYGPDIAIAFAGLFKTGGTIDDAIAALEIAKTETAEDALALAKAKVVAGVIKPPLPI